VAGVLGRPKSLPEAGILDGGELIEEGSEGGFREGDEAGGFVAKKRGFVCV